MEEIKIKVKGMMCEGCEKRVQNALTTIDGITKVTANHNIGTVIIKADTKIEKNILQEKIEDIGFEIEEN